jgi:DNA-binding response OmpR family regulator
MDPKHNVLVIDENADLRESLKQCLSKLGCAVETAASAETGIEKLRRFQYDAIFSALCLKRFGGTGMARWVKNNTVACTKFFLTTGWKGDLDPELLRSIGIHHVIRNPFVFSEVRDTVLEHLG